MNNAKLPPSFTCKNANYGNQHARSQFQGQRGASTGVSRNNFNQLYEVKGREYKNQQNYHESTNFLDKKQSNPIKKIVISPNQFAKHNELIGNIFLRKNT
jgi:hypothetical protein